MITEALLEHAAVYRVRQMVVDKRQTIAALFELAGNVKGRRVLELGCGPGTNVHLFEAASAYTGVDINPDYIQKAKRSHPHRTFFATDAVGFEPEEKFDLVLIDSFLHHIDDESIRRIVRCVPRWLAPDGAFVVQEPLIPSRRELYHQLLMRLDRGDHFRSIDHYKRLAEASGLAIARVHLSSLRFLGMRSHHYVSLLLRAPG